MSVSREWWVSGVGQRGEQKGMLRDPASLRKCSKAVSGPQLTGKPAGLEFLAKGRRVERVL